MRELVQEIWPLNSSFTRKEQWAVQKVTQPPRTHSAVPHDRHTYTCHQKPPRNLRVHPGLRARSERVSNSNSTDSCTASQGTRMQERNEALREIPLQLESLQQFCARAQQTHKSSEYVPPPTLVQSLKDDF